MHALIIPIKKIAVDKATIDTSISIIIVPPIAPGIIIGFWDGMVGIIVCNEVAITACREK